MDREAWRPAVHGIARSQTQLSDWTEGVDLLHCNTICLWRVFSRKVSMTLHWEDTCVLPTLCASSAEPFHRCSAVYPAELWPWQTGLHLPWSWVCPTMTTSTPHALPPFCLFFCAGEVLTPDGWEKCVGDSARSNMDELCGSETLSCQQAPGPPGKQPERVKSSGQLQVGEGRFSGGRKVVRYKAAGWMGQQESRRGGLRFQRRLEEKWGAPTCANVWRHPSPQS